MKFGERDMNQQINKIIYIFEQPFTARIFDVFGVEILISQGFDVEIWDLTPYLHSTFFRKIDEGESMAFNKCKKFENKTDIVTALSHVQSDALINCFIPFNIHTFFIYHLLSVRNIKYCVSNMVTFPTQCIQQKSQLTRFKRTLMNAADILKQKNGMSTLCNTILSKYCLPKIKPADIALLSGERSLELNNDRLVGKKTHLMWVHNHDYDIYLKLRNNQKKADPSMVVFLDDYLPLSTDYYYINQQPPIGVEEYYANICSFFDYVEMNYNVRIVIAAHPRSKYNKSVNYFGDRTIIKGRTAELVQESAVVFAHMSTSINFAVLFRKPIVFLTMAKLKKRTIGRYFVGRYIETIAQSLNKNPVNIDNVAQLDWEKELHIDREAYARYQNDYIKKVGTPEIPFWEIFAQNIKKMSFRENEG